MKKEVELTLPVNLGKEPILYESIKKSKVLFNIIEASFSSKVGWALLKLDGSEEDLEELFNFWKSKNIIIDVREEE